VRSLLAIWAALASCVAAQDMRPRAAKIPRNGFDFWYRTLGFGAPVVILSGGPGMDCDYMTPVFAELARKRLAILPELAGTGRSRASSITSETAGLAANVAALDALRASMGHDRWTMLGHSAGAMLAIAYAGAHPDRVQALVLVSSGPVSGRYQAGAMDNVRLRLTAEERTAMDRALEKGDIGAAILSSTPGYFYDRQKALDFKEQFRPGSFHPDAMKVMNDDMHAPGVDLKSALGKLDRPVLVITGRQDPFDPAIQDEIAAPARSATVVYIDRCGHFPWIEQPREFFNAVADFLSLHAR
jgi:proline iminopeptidase